VSKDIQQIISNFRNAIEGGAVKFDKEETDNHHSRRDSEGYTPGIVRTSPSSIGINVTLPGGHSRLVGRCARAHWFRHNGAVVTDPPTISSLRRMHYGKVIEQQEHKYADAAGLTIEHNMRMKIPLIGNNISIILAGEVDSILRDPITTEKFIYECKSFYGYESRKTLFGTNYVRKPNTKGRPKLEHLLQVVQYLAMLSELNINDISYVYLFYVDRTDCHDASHIVELSEDKDNNAIPIVNNEPFLELNLKAILTRHMRLCSFMKDNKIPPRDSNYIWNDEKIRDLHESNQISSKAFREWQTHGKPIGDYQCRYCNYQHLCLGRFPNNKATWPTDDIIIRNMNDKTLLPSSDKHTNDWDALLGS